MVFLASLLIFNYELKTKSNTESIYPRNGLRRDVSPNINFVVDANVAVATRCDAEPHLHFGKSCCKSGDSDLSPVLFRLETRLLRESYAHVGEIGSTCSSSYMREAS